MLYFRKVFHFAILFLLVGGVFGCSIRDNAAAPEQADETIRQLIATAGAEIVATESYALAMSAQISTAILDEANANAADADTTIETAMVIDGTVSNQEPHFYLVGDLSISNQSANDFIFSMVEPETSAYMPYVNLLYDRALAAGATYEQSFQVLGVETTALPSEIWTDYDNADYLIFHDLVDGRLRFYSEEDYTMHYSKRVSTSLTALADEANGLYRVENEADGTIEITGEITDDFSSVLTLFWINANHLFVDYFPDFFNFTLTLDAESLLPLELKLIGNNHELNAWTTSGQYTIVFSDYNQTHVETSIPSDQIVYYAPDGLADAATVFRTRTTVLPLPEIVDANWDSRTIQIDDTLLTLPFSTQALFDLGFKVDQAAREIAPNTSQRELFSRDGLALNVYFSNPTNEIKPLAETEIQTIALFADNLRLEQRQEIPIYFPGGISIGSYLEEVDNRLPAPQFKDLNGGDTFRTAFEILYVWQEEAGGENPSLEYSIHPQSKQVYYLYIQ